jgi:hypothetical protein
MAFLLLKDLPRHDSLNEAAKAFPAAVAATAATTAAAAS